MKEIKTFLPEELIDELSTQAKQKGINISQLIRERLLQSPSRSSFTTDDFHNTVNKVRRRSSFGLDRRQAESLVATVVNEFFGPKHA